MARSQLAAAVLLALIAVAAAQVPTSAPTKAPTVPTATTTPTATIPPTATTTPIGTTTPTTTAGPPSTATPTCKSGYYLKKSAKKCYACVSRASTGKRTSVGRVSCWNPVASGTATTCSPAKLQGVKIRSTTNKTKATSCIKATGGVTVIFLPIKGTSGLKFINAGSYSKASLRLGGSIPASSQRGRVITVREKFGGHTMLKFSFNDKYHVLKKQRGKTISLKGVAARDGALLDYCFMVSLKVCK